MATKFLKFANRFTQAFKCQYPIVLAPMGGISGSELAAAVSKAGGIGFVGTGGQNPHIGIRYTAVGEINSQLRRAQYLANNSNTVGIGLRIEGTLDENTEILDQGTISRLLLIQNYASL